MAPGAAHGAVVTLTTGDANGTTTSFNGVGHWSNGQAPSGTNDYVNNLVWTAGNYLRTPADGIDHIFLGNSLTLSNNSRMLFKGTSSTANITITNLILNNGYLGQDMGAGFTANLNGNITLGVGNGYLQSQSAGTEVFNINSTITGAGSLIVPQKNNFFAVNTGQLTNFLNTANYYSGGTFLVASNIATEAPAMLVVAHDGGVGLGNVTVSNLAVLTLTGGASNDYINNSASLILVGAPTVNLNFSGSDTIHGLSFDGGATFVSAGIWGSPTSGATFTTNLLSGTGTFLVSTSNILPAIALQPVSQTNNAGQSAQFNVVASGYPTPSYQWRVAVNGNYVNLNDGGNVSGSATPTLTINNLVPANGTNYVVVITNVAGSVTSSVAALTVFVPASFAPVISQQPVSEILYAGITGHFTVAAIGNPAPFYQWRVQSNGTYVNLNDGGSITGSTNTTLNIANLTTVNATNYIVVITNSLGSVTSSIVNLAVVAPVGGYASAVVSNSPVAFYELNETGDPATNAPAFDYAGGFTGIYGTAVLNGNPNYNIVGPQPTDGFPGFTGTNTAAQFAGNILVNTCQITLPQLNLNTNTVTLTAWLYPKWGSIYP